MSPEFRAGPEPVLRRGSQLQGDPRPRPFLRSSGPMGRPRGPGWVCRLAGRLALGRQPHGGHVPLASGWPPGRSPCLRRCRWESQHPRRPRPPAPTVPASAVGRFTPSPGPGFCEHSRPRCLHGWSRRSEPGQPGLPLAWPLRGASTAREGTGRARTSSPVPDVRSGGHSPWGPGRTHPLPEGSVSPRSVWAGEAPGGGLAEAAEPAHVRGRGRGGHHGGRDRNQSRVCSLQREPRNNIREHLRSSIH